MNKNDMTMSQFLQKIIETQGFKIFSNTADIRYIISECIEDDSILEERKLLDSILATDVMQFLATTDIDNYERDKKKAKTLLVHLCKFEEPVVERVFAWFDRALQLLDEKVDYMQMIYDLERKLESEQEDYSPIDALKDNENTDNIVMYTADGARSEFEQIAVMDMEGTLYAILKPLFDIPGVEEDQALVFKVAEEDGEEILAFEEDEIMVDKVFEEYHKMLRDADVDVD